jgi:hypothetical protein
MVDSTAKRTPWGGAEDEKGGIPWGEWDAATRDTAVRG